MDEKPFESMNMIPFIDIMLVLLTIVLMTSSFIASGKIPVHLPQASSSNIPDRDKQRAIEITANGDIFLDGRTVTPDVLKADVSALAKDTPFLVRADKDVKLQRFIDVADVLKQLGFSRVAVQTAVGTGGR